MPYPEPLHSRFRLAPSGDVHLGHIALAWLSMNAARLTGGTFTMRAQQLWATREITSLENYREYAHRNLNELIDLGIEPSQSGAFKLHGMSPSWRFQVTDDRALIDYYWHELGLDALWGEWPVNPRMSHALDTDQPWVDEASWNFTIRYKHPYLQFAQLVGEVTTERNCIIRGEDHKSDESFASAIYPLLAKKHYGLADYDRTGMYTPCQWFMPHITLDAGWKLSSSNGANQAGYYAKDILAARIPSEKLFAYIGKLLFGSVEEAERLSTNFTQQIPLDPENNHLRAMPQAGVRSVMEGLWAGDRKVVDPEDWARFLRTGNVMA